ncbi:MAG TPA: tetratricopeptide repeat protein [Urbifossiella sp.]|nr:tetratricopeptide repeat protein [Urbifossiella sp.]
MPTINRRFLLKLVLVVLGLGGSLAAAHALQARRIPDALRRQADRSADAGKSDAAIHYLRQYLEFEPTDVEAHVRLIELIRTRATTGRGLNELVFLYDKVLRLDPDRDDTRRQALAHCLRVGRFSDAAAHADALLKKFPDEGTLWQQLGTAQHGLNQIPDARKSFESAIAKAPDAMLNYQRLAQLLWKNQSDPAGARAVLDRMVAAVPLEPQAYLVRARFETYAAEDDERANRPVNLDPACRDLRRMLELDPENAEGSLLLAEILQKGRDIPAAHAILRDAAGLYPRELKLVRALAWLELIRGNVPAALAALEDGLKHTPDGFDLLVPLADLLVQQGDTARTADILRQLEAKRLPPSQVTYLKARLAMRQEKWAESIDHLEKLRGRSGGPPGLETQANLLLATCYERTGDAENQERALKRVVAADPGHVPARVGVALLFQNLGRFDDSMRELDVAVGSPLAPGAVVSQWVRMKAHRLRHASASPDDWRKLDAAVTTLAPRFGFGSSEPVVLRAEVLAAQAKYAEAAQLLRRAASSRPGDTRLWAALAHAAADAGGTAAGLAVIDEAQAAAGDGPDVRIARARLYAREPGRVRPLAPLADRTDGWAEADQLRLLYGLADVADESGDRAKAVEVFRAIAARRPTDAAGWLRLAERAADAGKADVAAEARGALVKLEGDAGPSVLVCDARVSPAAAEKLAAVVGASPNRADACLALARFKADAGDVKESLRLTERAFHLEPTGLESARAWVVALVKAGPDDRAAKAVARLAADPRWAGEPFRRLMAGVVERVPPAAAPQVVAWCKPVIERELGGPAWLAARSPASAEAILTAATTTPTATADDWLRLAIHHGAKAEQVNATFAAARAKLPPSTFFAAAAVFAETPAGKAWAPAAADPAEKRAFTQARLAVALSRADSDAAVKVLEAFVADPTARPADAGWAKRNLAMLLASRGTPEGRTRATSLLAEANEGGATVEDLRATAGVLTTLARYLEGDDRRAALARAAAALDSVHKSTQSPRDLYNLSQLHRVAGDRKAARDGLNALMKADPRNLYYLVAALDELTEDRNFASAEAFAGRLRSLYPGEFRAVASVARYEAKAGKADRALALAEAYAGAADAGAGDYLARSARTAELLDELCRMPGVKGTPAGRAMAAAAAQRFSALVPSRPEAVVGVAGVLASDGQPAEALAKIEQFGRYLPDRVRAQAGLAVLRAGGATDRQFDLVRGWLDKAIAAAPADGPMRLAEAEFLTLRQEPEKAAEVYTKMLERDPRNVVALNNLAWLLAADATTAPRALELLDRAAREAGVSADLLDTRGRTRITLRQFDAANRDIMEAIARDPSALRYFHLALLRLAQSPPQPDAAAQAFRDAKARGLDARSVHPADLATFRLLDAANP